VAIVHDDDLAGVLLQAPAGVALLAELENTFGRNGGPDAVTTAIDAVGAMSFGELVAQALNGAHDIGGPWTAGAPAALAEAYAAAEARRPVAEAVVARFGPELKADLDRSVQQWWHGGLPKEGYFAQPRFRDYSMVYGNGEFTWAGLWTVSDPPIEAHESLAWTWELFPGPASRWHLPVRQAARIFEIGSPSDWASLVGRYPKGAKGLHAGWELPGPNQHPDEVRTLAQTTGQHALRTTAFRHLLPDWGAAANDYDGVHLSWAGFLTAEGYVADLGDGSLTMLRYWGSERTLWLNDVFGEAEPLPHPRVTGSRDADGRADAARQRLDREVLDALLGRVQ
jgi:hypothetical protein